MRRFIIPMLACAFLFVSVAWFLSYRNNAELVVIPGNTTAPIVHYKNETFGIELDRPENTLVSDSPTNQYVNAVHRAQFEIALPKLLFQETNLTEALIQIGVSAESHALNKCLVADDSSREKSIGAKSINGVSFSVFSANDAAAGNRYEFRRYRTIHYGSCYEFVEAFHSGNIANYPSGTVKEFDHDSFLGTLEEIMNSVNFSAKSASGVEGKITLKCEKSSPDVSCDTFPAIVEFSQKSQVLATTSTDDIGNFRQVLTAGLYDVNRTTSTSSACTSVGVEVKENSFAFSNIMCQGVQK